MREKLWSKKRKDSESGATTNVPLVSLGCWWLDGERKTDEQGERE